jgi:GPH family glycoside/pentoside/hexuronide:cation symporter
LLTVCLFLVTFSTTKERIQPKPEQKTKLLEDLSILFRNRHWVIMFVAGMLDLTFIIIRAATLVYYCKYYLNFDEGRTTTFLLLGNVGFIAGAIATRFLVRAVGKKAGLITAHIILAVTAAATFLVPPEHLWLVMAMQILHTIGGGFNATLYWAMIADTADFSEWKFKVRTTGIVFSATTCSQKIGMGIGGAVTGYLLTSFGYAAGVAQTAQANQGILLLVSLIPAAGFVLVAILFLFYGLNEDVCKTVREDLAKRRAET